MRLWIGAWRLVATVLLVSGAGAAAAAPPPPPRQAAAFLVDPASGALVPLEHVKDKQEDSGHYRYPYLPGAQSIVTLPAGVPLRFVLRIDEKSFWKDDELRNYFGTKSCLYLERFLSKKDRRYRTGSGFRLELEASEIVRGLDPKKPDLGSLIISLKSAGLTAPGEYGVVHNDCSGKREGPSTQYGAFRVVTAAAQPAAPPAASAARPAPATDMRALRAAAEAGDASAQAKLGVAYALGEGVLQDDEAAATWMLRAAEQGQAVAQAYIGQFYATGRGVAADAVEAYKWLNLAASRLTGEEQKTVAAGRDQVAAGLSPAQRTEGQRRSREWVERFEGR